MTFGRLPSYEDIFLCVALEPDRSKKAVLDIYRGMPRSIGFDQETIDRFVGASSIALGWLNDKLNHEHKKIVTELKAFNIDELYSSAVEPSSLDNSTEKVRLDFPFE